HTTPGRAKPGQSQRPSPTAPRSSAGLLTALSPLLYPGPRLEPALVLLRRQLLRYLAHVEVALLDNRGREVLADHPVGDELVRLEGVYGWLVGVPAKVFYGHLVFEYVVEEHVGEDR